MKNFKWNHFQKFFFVGFYWIFTIITTACYTGSIIAFVTIPVYPVTIDTVRQLLDNRYQVGTLGINIFHKDQTFSFHVYEIYL